MMTILLTSKTKAGSDGRFAGEIGVHGCQFMEQLPSTSYRQGEVKESGQLSLMRMATTCFLAPSLVFAITWFFHTAVNSKRGSCATHSNTNLLRTHLTPGPVAGRQCYYQGCWCCVCRWYHRHCL